MIPEEGERPRRRPQRHEAGITYLAAFGLLLVTGVAVAALAYDAVLNKSQGSLNILGTLATLGFGGLLALAGAKKGES